MVTHPETSVQTFCTADWIGGRPLTKALKGLKVSGVNKGMPIEAARKRLGDIILAAMAGRTIVITRYGRPVAQIAPYRPPVEGAWRRDDGLLTVSYVSGRYRLRATDEDSDTSLSFANYEELREVVNHKVAAEGWMPILHEWDEGAPLDAETGLLV